MYWMPPVRVERWIGNLRVEADARLFDWSNGRWYLQRYSDAQIRMDLREIWSFFFSRLFPASSRSFFSPPFSLFELVLKIMDDSTSDCQLNQGKVDYEFESNEVPEFLTWYILQPLSVVDDQFVPKVGMTFTTLEDAGKFYRNYVKAAGFSTRVRSTNRNGNEIKNQLITCSREGK
ncbi:hypothetical protein Ahy_B10g102298 [Arachis hypogaea]|uniref:FAR1 domain-containing protein n=1 Tax=Arachis hypogaea TaxID=3818 RepID=A0A444X1P4_ARAHY|nr:hypothetical protein Ahy_B10g102298 [Arachis hypogaea]